jgi:protein phosphatase PTC7
MLECGERLATEHADLDLSYNAADCNTILTESHKEIVENTGKKFYGGATVCFTSIDPTRHVLSGVNLGDSGWRVFRDGEVFAASEDQRHSVFTPWQLCKKWDDLNVIDDDPDDADAQDVDVQVGDVVIVATDGLYDNL